MIYRLMYTVLAIAVSLDLCIWLSGVHSPYLEVPRRWAWASCVLFGLASLTWMTLTARRSSAAKRRTSSRSPTLDELFEREKLSKLMSRLTDASENLHDVAYSHEATDQLSISDIEKLLWYRPRVRGLESAYSQLDLYDRERVYALFLEAEAIDRDLSDFLGIPSFKDGSEGWIITSFILSALRSR